MRAERKPRRVRPDLPDNEVVGYFQTYRNVHSELCIRGNKLYDEPAPNRTAVCRELVVLGRSFILKDIEAVVAHQSDGAEILTGVWVRGRPVFSTDDLLPERYYA